MAVAALAHGAVGFGFPVISTPTLALFTDVETAVLATLVPNLAVNLVSVVQGGSWRQSIGRHWPVAIYVLIGTVAGTHALLVIDPAPIKLLLAAMIVVYLQQKRLRLGDTMWLRRHPQAGAVVFGLAAGFLSGTVNVALPPLIIYFVAVGVAPVAMTQVLNLCFLVGRSTQAVTFAAAGKLTGAIISTTLPLTALSIAVLLAGMRIQRRIRPEHFHRLLRALLWLMAAALVAQVLWSWR